ncbi:DUF3987 domain-containing protein [Gimesia chilikensis]|uniref:DUF3987 domain-containing protein n=1 Tax=Gimesia chilikensis TaxID=2605989 RepID=UPI001E38EE77|nr:DUF3987 domain-containing protein [Gimesia chilikensis]
MPVSDQIERLEADQGRFDAWAETKPPITGAAVAKSGALLCLWPKRAPQGKQIECIAFPAYRDGSEPAGIILYRSNGENFPEIENGPGERKTHLLKGSQDGWVISGDLDAAETIIKVEGVPDWLVLAPHVPDGYAVVTNTHGAGSAAKNCPLDPFNGKRVIIIGDADESGVSGANGLAREVSPYALEVKVIIPDGEIAERGGKDLRDVMNENLQSGYSLQDTVRGILKKAEQQEPFQPVEDEPARDETDDGPGIEHKEPEQYESIPVDCFPSVLAKYGKEAADCIGCDPCFVMLPLLVATGSLLGGKRCLFFNSKYQIPSNLWGAVVAPSGTGKSPGFNAALSPMFKLQAFIEEKNREAFDQHDKDRLTYESELKDWKQKARKADTIPPDEPEKPEPPAVKAYTIDDSTSEATVLLLKDNPNGFLQQKDELSGLFADHDKYTKAKGSDAAMYLKAFDGTPLQNHRKGDRKPIYIPRPLISLAGGIQPAILKVSIPHTYRQNGMMGRFVFVYPPEKPLPLPSTKGVSEKTEREIDQLYQTLCDLAPYKTLDNGGYVPQRVYLSDDAMRAYERFFNQNRDEWFFKGDLVRSAWSKFNQIVLRIALIFQCVENATSGDDGQRVSLQTMQNAIRLTEFFKKETLRVYRIFDSEDEPEETPEQKQYRRLFEFVKDKGGTVSVRETQQGVRFKTADETEKALGELVKTGAAEWVDIPTKKKGRPSRGISLKNMKQCNSVTQQQKPLVLSGSVTGEGEFSGFEPFQEPEQAEATAPDDLGDFMEYLD